MGLDKASHHSYHGETYKGLLERVRDGNLQLWEYEDDKASGLVGTILIDRKVGRELWIDILVGKGFLERAVEVHAAIVELAKSAQANRITGFAVRPGLARLYREVLKVPPAATVFSEEV